MTHARAHLRARHARARGDWFARTVVLALVLVLPLLVPTTSWAGDGNDDFINAVPITTASFSVAGSNVGATRDMNDPGNTYGSVWFALTSPVTTRIAIDVDDCDYDSYLRVQIGGPGVQNTSVVASNDDSATAYCSALNLDVVAGSTYYIAVGGYSATSSGTFTLHGVGTAPANDAFASAEAIPGDTATITANTIGATQDIGEVQATFGSIWYSWTPTQSGDVWIDAAELPCQWRVLRLYTGATLGTLSEVVANTGSCPTRITANVTAGTTYKIAVGYYGDSWIGGSFDLRIRRGAPNDAFANAEVLVGDDTSRLGTTFGATVDAGEVAATFASVWYEWTPTTSRTVSIRTRDCTFDSFVLLYTGAAVGSLVQVAQNDNAESGTCSLVRAAVTAGTTYRIAVGSKAATVTGDFRLTIDAEPLNDEFAAAIPIAGDPIAVSGTTYGATQDVGDATNTLNSIWYAWTPTRAGTAYVHTRTCDFDSYLRIFTGSTLGSLTQLASNNDSSGTSCSSVLVDVQGGATYYVQVGGAYASAYGSFTLRASVNVGNDSFTAATSLTTQFAQLGGIASARTRAQGATREVGEPVQAARADLTGTTWYRFTSDRTTTVTIDTIGSSGDTALSVYTGASLAALTPVVENDDAAPGVTTSLVSVPITTGTSYYIAVAATNATHAVRINGPVNDRFVDALDIAGLAGSGAATTAGALIDDDEPAIGGAMQIASVWYRWTAPTSQIVAIDTQGSLVPPNLAVYTGSNINALTLVGTATSGTPRRLEFAAVAGTTYRISLATSTQRGEARVRVDPPPANDKLASATAVPVLGARLIGTSTGATREVNEPVHGGRMGEASVWFKWTPSTSATVRYTTNGSGYDTHLGVYQGPELASLTQIAADDDSGWGTASDVTFAVTAGQPYYIAISSPDNARGSWQLNAVAPSNDDVGEAQVLAAVPGTVTVSTRAATLQLDEPVHATTSGTRSVWYQWTAPASAVYGIDTSGSTVDTVLSAWTGVPETLTRIASNDDALGGTVTWSQLRLTAVAGTTYWFAVRDKSSGGGDMSLTAQRVPPNDPFGSATNIPGDRAIVRGWTIAGSHEAGEPDHAGVGTDASSWWKWTATFTGTASVDTRGSDYDAVLGVYTGASVSALTLVAADDNAMNPDARVTFAATTGTTYYIAVDGAAGDRGQVTLRLNIPSNDHAFDATPLVAEVTATGSLLGATMQPGELGDCSAADRASVWYSFTPTNRNVMYETVGSSVDTTLELYTGDPSSIATLTRRSQACGWWGGRPRLQYRTTVPGQTVYLRVGTQQGNVGAINLIAHLAPVNDDIDQPTSMTGWATSATGSLNYATAQAAPTPEQTCASCPSIWYEWIAPASGPASFDTHATSTANHRTTWVSVWDGTVPGSESLVVRSTSAFATHTRARFTAVAGTRYLVLVEGSSWDANFGDVTLRANQAAPANDAFATRQVVGGADSWTFGTTWNATRELPDEPDHATSGGQRSVWYQWTAPVTNTATIDTLANDGDTVLAVYQGASLATLTQVAANDDAEPGGGSRVTFAAVTGETYLISVDTKDTGSDFNLHVFIPTPPPPTPANDSYDSAIPIADGIRAVVTGDSYGATHEPDEVATLDSCTTYHSVWYEWTPSYTGTVVIDTVGSAYDTTLAVYRGPRPTNGARIAANDDIGGSPHNQRSRLRFGIVAGQTYRISVDGCNGGRWGAFTLRVNPPPDNDSFATPATVNPADVSTTVHVISATAEASEPAHGGTAAASSSWYSFTPTTTGDVTFDTRGSTFDTTIGVYTGAAVNALTLVADNDDAYAGETWSSVTFTATAGTNYRIAIDSRSALSLTAQLNFGRAPNDFIQNAVPLATRRATASVGVRHLSMQAGEPAQRVLAGSGCTAWYTWTAPGTGVVTMDTFASTAWDTGIDVYTGALDTSTLVLVAGNDTTLGNHARVRFLATIGTPYRIRVEADYCDAYPSSSQIALTLVQQPPNDDLANALVVNTWSSIVTESTVEATKEVDEPTHGTAPTGASVWYDWTPPQSGTATLTLFGSTYDTALGVYTGATVNALTTIATSDDSGSSQQSIATFDVVAGTTYHVAVDGYLAATGDFTLNFNITPPNDRRGDAIALIGPRVRTTGYNTSATTEVGEPAHAGTLGRSIWYTWTASANGPVDADTFGTAFDTTLAVYTGPTIGTLVPVASNDDSPGRAQSRVSFVATAGTTYVFAIDGVADAQGITSLRINPLDPLVPVLLAPSDTGPSEDLTPRLTARYEHADGAVVGRARYELCHAPVDPGGDWSVTCPDGYATHLTSSSLGDGSTAIWEVGAPLAVYETYVWRVRDLDNFTWSAWSAASTFVASASITVDFSSLGHDAATRAASGVIDFGATQPSGNEIGPPTSGQVTPGSALELTVASDATTRVSASAPDFVRSGGGPNMPVATLDWRDATGTGEGIQTTAWTPFTNAPATFEQSVPGSWTYRWWMRWTPGTAIAGDYSTAITMTVVAIP